MRKINSFDINVLFTAHLSAGQLYWLPTQHFPSRPLTENSYNLHQISKCSVWDSAHAYRSAPASRSALHGDPFCGHGVSILKPEQMGLLSSVSSSQPVHSGEKNVVVVLLVRLGIWELVWYMKKYVFSDENERNKSCLPSMDWPPNIEGQNMQI